MHRRIPSERSSSSTAGSDRGSSSNGHIRVVVRVRPPNEAESITGGKTIVRVLDEHVLIFDPLEDTSGDFYRGRPRRGRDLNKRKNRDVRFAFDHVFDIDAQNVEVFDNTTKLILDGLLDGYNCAVFAYGATGAGKTYTMLGNYNTPGVMFLTMMDLYRRIEEMKAEKTCDVAVSYLEVYNEQIADLLVPKGFLPVREDPQAGVVIPGLSLHKPKSAEELLKMLNFGNKNRTQHPTDANAESSRSHAVFQVFVRQHDRTANISTDVRIAKMSLIDLAGSERAQVTTNRGARFREGANINKSLLALGNCINALAEGKSKGYIPYRNSKLTRLLKDSLGGNCHTVMIAAISPCSSSFEDTYNTLCYANRAKNIKAQLKRNVLSVDFHISKYAKIVDELRQEVSELKTKLKVYEDAPPLPPQAPLSDQETNRLSVEMETVFQERRHIRQELLELEGKERDLAIRLNIKEKCLFRVRTICLQSDEKAISKISHMIKTIRMKQERVLSRKQKLTERIAENGAKLQQIETDISNMRKSGASSELLECRLKMLHQEVELLDTKRHVRSLQNICRYQQNHVTTTEKLVLGLLQAYRHVYFVLRGHHLATNDIVSQFDNIQHLVEGEREVIWADQCAEERQQSPDPDKIFLDHILQFPVLHADSSAADVENVGVTPFKLQTDAAFCYPETPADVATPGLTPRVVHGQTSTQTASASMASSGMCYPVTPVLCSVPDGTTPAQRQNSVRLNLSTSYQSSEQESKSEVNVMPPPPVPVQLTGQPAPSVVEHLPATPRHGQVMPQPVLSTPHCVQRTAQLIQPAAQRIQVTPQHVQPSLQLVQPVLQHVQATPLYVQPTSLATQPSLQCTQPSLQCTQPSLQHTLQYTQPTPQRAQPTPQHAQPTPQRAQPTPQCAQPTPQRVQPTPQRVQPTPQCVQPTPQCAQPMPQLVHPTPQHVQSTPHHVPPSTEPSHSGRLSPVVLSRVPQTFNTSLMEGITPLMPTPDRSGPASGTEQMNTPEKPIPPTACTMVTMHQSSLANVSPTKLAIGAASTSTAPMPCASTSSALIQSGTVTKSAFTAINTSTVTKSAPDTTQKEDEGLSKVKRAMQFAEKTSPEGRCMTFAEVVKSPGVNLKRQLSDSSVFRSPLANRENIIHTTDNGLPKKRMLSEKNRNKQKLKCRSTSSLQSVVHTGNKVQRSLHQMGLPSTMDMKKNNSNVPKRNLERPKSGKFADSSPTVSNLRQRSTSAGAMSNNCFKPKRQRTDENRRPLLKRSLSQNKFATKPLQHRPAFI